MAKLDLELLKSEVREHIDQHCMTMADEGSFEFFHETIFYKRLDDEVLLFVDGVMYSVERFA